MKKKKELAEEVRALLYEAASSAEQEQLREMELSFKRPTRMTVIAATLYKKAAGGELSAIKELLSIVGLSGSGGGVTLVDDIGKS